MAAEMVTFGPWQIPVAVKQCLCPDGKRRRARITGEADTYFSIPASVTVRVPECDEEGRSRTKAVTVSGFVTGREGEAGEQDYEFIPYTYRKNAGAFAALAAGRA